METIFSCVLLSIAAILSFKSMARHGKAIEIHKQTQKDIKDANVWLGKAEKRLLDFEDIVDYAASKAVESEDYEMAQRVKEWNSTDD